MPATQGLAHLKGAAAVQLAAEPLAASRGSVDRRQRSMVATTMRRSRAEGSPEDKAPVAAR
eukprot:scaffold7214_cov410-Prasinococcus_capsulatus_cf.AAC.22